MGFVDNSPGYFFGVCAGTRDLPVAFGIAGQTLNRFVFCDLSYGKRISAKAAVPDGWMLLSQDGPVRQRCEKTTSYNGDRPFIPLFWREVWKRPDGSEAIVELHCDLAQDVLLKFPPSSIAAFMHINDSTGEGGSDLWFLGMPKSEKLESERGQRLLPELVPRLADGAIVITDGCLAEKSFEGESSFECQNVRWQLEDKLQVSQDTRRPVRLWRMKS